ncbi:helix-turn-helix domain-containing protein [Pseudomonas sp.]|uniref:helix-turn-helix domain-containing protein n=1 Tax=Pseudomonas sp. TaxID=306 RepID=UPI003F39D26E
MPQIKPQVDFIFNPRCIQREVDVREHPTMTTELGDYIKIRLKALKKTQGWLAEKTNVSNNAVSKWVKTGKISRENFLLIIPMLGGSVPTLTTSSDDNPVASLVSEPHAPEYLKHRPINNQRDQDTAELLAIANMLDSTGLGMLIQEARRIQRERPISKTA